MTQRVNLNQTYVDNVQQVVALIYGFYPDNSLIKNGTNWDNCDSICLNSDLKPLITPSTNIAASLKISIVKSKDKSTFLPKIACCLDISLVSL